MLSTIYNECSDLCFAKCLSAECHCTECHGTHDMNEHLSVKAKVDGWPFMKIKIGRNKRFWQNGFELLTPTLSFIFFQENEIFESFLASSTVQLKVDDDEQKLKIKIDQKRFQPFFTFLKQLAIAFLSCLVYLVIFGLFETLIITTDIGNDIL